MFFGGVASADAPRLPAHYAKIFQAGATWTYDIAETSWDAAKLRAMEDRGIDIHKLPSSRWPRHTDKQHMTCKVARIATYKKAIVSEVTCDRDLKMRVDIAGTYLATDKALYRLYEFPATEADLPSPLDGGDAEIAAAPKVARVVEVIEKAAGGGRAVRGIRVEGGSWCKYDEMIANAVGHNGKGSTCYGRGIPVSVAQDFGPDLRDIKLKAR